MKVMLLVCAIVGLALVCLYTKQGRLDDAFVEMAALVFVTIVRYFISTFFTG